MGEAVVTTRAMEEFLINPTEMNDRYAESRPPTLKTRQPSGLRSSALEDNTLALEESHPDPLAEQLYLRGYASDEEALSSADSDNISINSASSGEILTMVPTRLSIVSAKDLERCSSIPIEQSIHCAHAVFLKPINIGNISPKLVDIPPSPRLERAPHINGYYRAPTSRLAKLDTAQASRHQRSVTSTSTPRTSLENTSNASTPSTPPTSIDERSPVSSSEKVLRRKSAVTSMRGAARRQPSLNLDGVPDAQNLREFLASEPSLHTKPLSNIPAHLATSNNNTKQRKLRKFSSSFSLGRFNVNAPFGKQRKDSSDANINLNMNSSTDTLPALPALNRQTFMAPPSPQTYIPSRGSSLLPPPKAPARMIARGANERAPPIVLPPCPDDSGDDDAGDADDVRSVRGIMRRAPKSYSPTGAPRPGRKLHRRHRSLSADDVMLAQ